ncbi:MAG: HAD family phosphatase [Marinilabiliales bacterium]|nr:HAD family phosphatase [Marinilabiliales bacterium]
MIKTLLLDLGGVLLNIDLARSKSAFASLGWREPEPSQQQPEKNDLFLGFETGHATPQNFREQVRQTLSAPASDDEIDRAWNAMLTGFYPEAIHLLERLATAYDLYLLSNTNEIHRLHFESMFLTTFGYPIHQLFKKCYYSHQMGLRKPDPAIFLKVLEETGASPQSTLFADDLAANVATAKQLGMATLTVQPGRLQQQLPESLRQ